jgi:hypothetical protein
MAHASISTWKTSKPRDEAGREALYRVMQEKYVPMTLSMGATSTMCIQTGPDTAAIVSVWPDEATRSAAMQKVGAMRGEASSAFDTTMTMEVMGEIRASG